MSRQQQARVTPGHLQRRAALYPRQSTPGQVTDNVGSTEVQLNQKEYALEMGWAADMMDLYDDDLGVSGRTIEGRTGMQRLLKAVANGDIGAIFASDISRLNRARSHFSGLVDLCRINGALLIIDGRIVDLDDPHDRFLANIRADVAEYDNDLRRKTLMDARWAKARMGRAVSAPPTGYVKEPTEDPKKPSGRWVKDPDQRIQDAINRLYDDYERLGSSGAVLRYYRKEGILLPSREGTQVSWGLSRAHIWRLLTNRAYRGDYQFGKRVCAGDKRQHREDADETVLIEGHHEPYLSAERWQRIQVILRANTPRVRQPAGRGLALSQGLLRCGRDNRKLSVTYSSRKRPYRYMCVEGHIRFGEPVCCSVSGPRLDALVAAEVLAALIPPDTESILAAVNDARAGYEAICRQRELELARAEGAVAVWTRQLAATMPEYQEVHVECQRNLNAAIRHRTAVQRQHRENPVSPPLVPTPEVLADINRLAQDLPTVWHAPSTTPHDRKRLVRLFVSEIRLMAIDRSSFTVALHWVGGAVTQHPAPQACASARLVRELADKRYSPVEILKQIQAQGGKTMRGRPYTIVRVREALQRARTSKINTARQG